MVSIRPGLNSDIHAEAAFRAHLISRHGQARRRDRAGTHSRCLTANPRRSDEQPLADCRARDAPQSLARLSALRCSTATAPGHFTPRDVIDEVIAALKSTDALCKVMTTDMFASARVECRSRHRGLENGDAKL